MAEGNIIHIEDIRLGVADACSGLGMMMTFFALATAYAILMDGSRWERFVILACSIPIALIANVIRIVVTGIAFYFLGKDSAAAKALFHDLAGWVIMMPVAWALLWAVHGFLRRLWVDEAPSEPLPILLGRVARASASAGTVMPVGNAAVSKSL